MLLNWSDRLNPALFPCCVSDIFLDCADGNGTMARLLDNAVAFAETILRTNPPAYLREGVGGLAYLISFAQPSFGRKHQPVGDIVVQRTMRLAIGHTTLAAAACLLFRLGVRILGIDLVKVRLPQISIALFRHVPFNGYKFEHRLICHIASSPHASLSGRRIRHRGTD